MQESASSFEGTKSSVNETQGRVWKFPEISDQQALDYSTCNVRQAIVTALKAVGQPGVINSQGMEQCGVQVVHLHSVFKQRSARSGRMSRLNYTPRAAACSSRI